MKQSTKNECNATRKPKRPMTPYNIFFKEQRKAILEQTGGHSGGFATLARTIAALWKTISPTEHLACTVKAAQDRERYKREMMLWSSIEKRVQICTNEPASYYQSPQFLGDGSAAATRGGENTRGPLVFDRRPASTSTPLRQEASSRSSQRFDAIEIASAPMGVKVSAEKRQRRLPESQKMDMRSSQILPIELPKLGRQVTIDSNAPKNLRCVFEDVAQLDADLPSPVYGPIPLELDDAICLREY